ncbi:unnamed protein product [Diabrotica balteata]|uniref:Uncharacterized protein n=1 Tax=Diabrotica balteata TaxID=107213 RepID=A0A9N9ST56_DIABA|nr:unnamed protein product [Diabrotica balteata]
MVAETAKKGNIDNDHVTSEPPSNTRKRKSNPKLFKKFVRKQKVMKGEQHVLDIGRRYSSYSEESQQNAGISKHKERKKIRMTVNIKKRNNIQRKIKMKLFIVLAAIILSASALSLNDHWENFKVDIPTPTNPDIQICNGRWPISKSRSICQ